LTGYLLSTKAIYEFVQGEECEAQDFWSWAQGLSRNDELYVSEISLGELWSAVDQLSGPLRRHWDHCLEKVIPGRFGARLLPFRRDDALQWGLIRQQSDPLLPAEEEMIIGQAISRNLTFVGPTTPAHVQFNCTTLDPYNGTPWPGADFG
tara:strand:+ start:6152 stop:6601 length:450 start_codon:yes stop_codon:yes gene_type:complete